jgi:O-antigen/teichoic acid export membrane protein
LTTSNENERAPGGSREGGLAGALGLGESASDHVRILAGTGQNVVGLAVFVLASFGMNILIARAFAPDGRQALGVVTLATQFAFIAGAGLRFGMDHAAVRRVAIDIGNDQGGRIRAVLVRAAAIAGVASLVAALGVFFAAPALSDRFEGSTADVFRAVALALPFIALCQVYLGGTRGLKTMKYTLYVQWAGQPTLWVVFTLAGWTLSKTVEMTVFTYALSWVVATAGAFFFWERRSARYGHLPAQRGEVHALVRYGAPRAPAALLAHLVFWTDYFVAYRYISPADRGVYAAAIQLGFALVLFLTAVSYMFSPYVADLHSRGERQKLDGLFKSITRWTIAGTVPLLLMLLVVPGPVLRLFGAQFETGDSALRILLIGQAVNVSVGAVGFVLIMVGRTGWDLVIYAGAVVLDFVLALVLAPKFGIEGAAAAQALTLIASNALRLYLVWRFVRIQPYDRHYVRLAIPTAIAGGFMLAAQAVFSGVAWQVDLIGTGVVGAFVYFTAFLLFGLTPTEKGAMMRVLHRGRAA